MTQTGREQLPDPNLKDQTLWGLRPPHITGHPLQAWTCRSKGKTAPHYKDTMMPGCIKVQQVHRGVGPRPGTRLPALPRPLTSTHSGQEALPIWEAVTRVVRVEQALAKRMRRTDVPSPPGSLFASGSCLPAMSQDSVHDPSPGHFLFLRTV